MEAKKVVRPANQFVLGHSVGSARFRAYLEIMPTLLFRNLDREPSTLGESQDRDYHPIH